MEIIERIKSKWYQSKVTSAEKAAIRRAEKDFEETLNLPVVVTPEKTLSILPNINDLGHMRFLKLLKIAKQWDPQSDVMVLRHGYTFSSVCATLLSIPMTQYFIKAFNVTGAKFYLTLGVGTVACGATFMLSSHLLMLMANFQAESRVKFHCRSGLHFFVGGFFIPINLAIAGTSYYAYLMDTLPPYKDKFIVHWASRDMIRYGFSVMKTKKFMGISALVLCANLLLSQLYADQLVYEYQHVVNTILKETEAPIIV